MTADVDIVLYCRSKNSFVSTRVAAAMRKHGIENLQVLAGGLEAWKARGFPLTARFVEPSVAMERLGIERLRAADQMTPARDRLLGITRAFLVMFFIFHQVRPERTVDTMRRLLARVLRAQAGIIRLFGVAAESERDAKIAGIRKQIATVVGTLQNFAHAVNHEFPPDRDGDMRLSNEILNAVARAEDLLVTLQTWSMELDGRSIRSVRRRSKIHLRRLSATWRTRWTMVQGAGQNVCRNSKLSLRRPCMRRHIA